ncbi:FKBP-type peptidyl-prolyl cis-trans isomerase [Sphingomonas oligophenolica]|uniref:Peptidyl-prolyl cis-trans isomerase n=1 Tax=Sphingomonas oligophenolica TaxID=301154 RepID=A0ABU9YAT7_9SPHN
MSLTLASPLRKGALPSIVLVGILSGVPSGVVQPAVAQVAPDPVATFLAGNRGAKGVVETASGLQYQVLEPGADQARPTDQDVALVNYEGRLADGTTFDKSEQPTPMPVTEVIPGFSEGLKLMTRGAKYRFWIKPSLGYGGEASGPIPANSLLVFDVEMIDFLPEAVVRQMMQQQQATDPGAAQPGTSHSK